MTQHKVQGGWINASLGLTTEGEIFALITFGASHFSGLLTPETLKELIQKDIAWRQQFFAKTKPKLPDDLF